MPEQQVAGPGEHAHTLEARGLAYVARAAVCGMQPQHIGLGAQAQVIADSSVYRGLRTLPAVTRAAHGLLRKKSGMSGTPAPLPVGRQSDEIASLVRGGRLSGGPIGCGVPLSRLMRAASVGSAAFNGMAIRAKLSAPRLASS